MKTAELPRSESAQPFVPGQGLLLLLLFRRKLDVASIEISHKSGHWMLCKNLEQTWVQISVRAQCSIWSWANKMGEISYIPICLSVSFPGLLWALKRRDVCTCACSVVSNSLWPPWTVAPQAPLSMGFPRQEYWSGLPFPPPGGLPNPGIEPAFSLAGGFFTTELSRNPKGMYWIGQKVHSSTLTNFLASAIYNTLSALADSSVCKQPSLPITTLL